MVFYRVYLKEIYFASTNASCYENFVKINFYEHLCGEFIKEGCRHGKDSSADVSWGIVRHF